MIKNIGKGPPILQHSLFLLQSYKRCGFHFQYANNFKLGGQLLHFRINFPFFFFDESGYAHITESYSWSKLPSDRDSHSKINPNSFPTINFTRLSFSNDHTILINADNFASIFVSTALLVKSAAFTTGSSCQLFFDGIVWTGEMDTWYGSLTNLLTLYGENTTLILNNSYYVNSSSYWPVFSVIKGNNTVRLLNFVIVYSRAVVFLTNNLDLDKQVIIELDGVHIYAATGSYASFGAFGCANIVSIRNTVIETLFCQFGLGAFFIVSGSAGAFKLDNVTINNLISYGISSLFNAVQKNNNLTIYNSHLTNSFSQYKLAIYMDVGFLDIENCTFQNFTSKEATLLAAFNLVITIRNLTFSLGKTSDNGFIILDSSSMQIANSSFSGLIGKNAAFLSAIESNFTLEGVSISQSSCTASYFSIMSSSFDNLQGGIIFFTHSFNNYSILSSNISNVVLSESNFIFLKAKNYLNISDCLFSKINSRMSGTLINTNEYNLVWLRNSKFSLISSINKGVFYIFNQTVLYVNACNFSLLSSGVSAGFAYSWERIHIISYKKIF